MPAGRRAALPMPGSGSNPRPVFQDPGVREGRRPARNTVTEMGLKRGGLGLQPPSSGLGSRPRGLQAPSSHRGTPGGRCGRGSVPPSDLQPTGAGRCRHSHGRPGPAPALAAHRAAAGEAGAAPPPPRPNGTLAFPHPSAPAAIRQLRLPPQQPTPHIPEINAQHPQTVPPWSLAQSSWRAARHETLKS